MNVEVFLLFRDSLLTFAESEIKVMALIYNPLPNAIIKLYVSGAGGGGFGGPPDSV